MAQHPSTPGNGSSGELTIVHDIEALADAHRDWNRLAALDASPFVTYEWISSWWSALGDGEPLCLLLRDSGGALLAGACCRRSRSGDLTAPTDVNYSEEWDIVAADEEARRRLWHEISHLGHRRVMLTPLHECRADEASAELEAAGYRVMRHVAQLRPYVPLPDTWDDLLASLSRKLRWQWRSGRRALDADGGLAFRTTSSVTDLDRDLDLFLTLEASGWKGRQGTAILDDPRAERLYREFAVRAARQGWLRLSILESDGAPVAAAYSCAFAGKAFRLKSGFDERRAEHSPGLVLVGEEMRRSIDEGLHEYDFLGAAQPHKMRWGAKTRPMLTLRGYRGASTLPAYAVRAKARPALGRLRRRLRRAGAEAHGSAS
jgi:CelD/BcsL family acetyltransferase involved in cellulose biosynthesis